MRDKTEQAYDAAAGYCLDAMQSLRRFSGAEAVAALRSAIDAIEREQQRAKRADRIRVRPAPMLFPVPKDSAERFGDFSRDDG